MVTEFGSLIVTFRDTGVPKAMDTGDQHLTTRSQMVIVIKRTRKLGVAVRGLNGGNNLIKHGIPGGKWMSLQQVVFHI